MVNGKEKENSTWGLELNATKKDLHYNGISEGRTQDECHSETRRNTDKTTEQESK